MRRNGWGYFAFALSTFLVAALLGGMSAVVIVTAFVVSAATLLGPQRTGPFPFLAFLFVCVGLRHAAFTLGWIEDEPDRSVGPMELATAAALALYILASCEFDALKHGIHVRRTGGLNVRPGPAGAALRSLLVGAGCWMVYAIVRDWGSLWVPEILEVATVRAGALLWLLLVLFVGASLTIGALEVRRGDRLSALMFVFENFWRPHRAALRFISRMVWKG
jgi:hypothetical protein